MSKTEAEFRASDSVSKTEDEVRASDSVSKTEDEVTASDRVSETEAEVTASDSMSKTEDKVGRNRTRYQGVGQRSSMVGQRSPGCRSFPISLRQVDQKIADATARQTACLFVYRDDQITNQKQAEIRTE